MAPSARWWSREWIYFSFVIAAWCFTPLLRRLIDYQHGAYSSLQVTSLIPFVMLLPFAPICFRRARWSRLSRPLRFCAYLWTGTFLYGFVIAAALGSVGAATFEAIQYLVPMLGGLWLAGEPLPATECFRRLCFVMLPCAGIVALYGIFQWINPPPWDVLWVVGAQFESAGQPVPFAMRVFSTLNSPGPAADFFALTMMLTLPLMRMRTVWMWPLVAALGAALLLTMIREAWVGLLVGAVAYIVASPRRMTALPSLAVYAILLVFLVSSLPALLGSGPSSDVIVSRITTLGDVGHDESALTRQTEIEDALTQGLANPFGSGLGSIGTAAKLGSNTQASSVGIVLDSGYLGRLLELGWLGALGYLTVTIGGPLMFAYYAFRRNVACGVDAKVIVASALAICATLAWGDAANDAHLGLDGFFFWIALAFGSLALQPATAEATERRVALPFRLRRSRA